jgi:hypothetical protein
VVAAALLAAGVGLAACGGGTNSDALAACRGVHAAIADYDRSLQAASSAQRAADLLSAEREVASVQQDAALANSADGGYNALMTLLQQAQEVPFHDVVPALTQVCSTITSPTNDL